MNLYNVLLDGSDDGLKYLLTVSVVADNQREAEFIAISASEESGLVIDGVEEISAVKGKGATGPARVIRVFGKTYYGDEQ